MVTHTLVKYFPHITQEQCTQLEHLCQLYRYWNEKINVISRKDIHNVFEHHILHSLAIAKFFNFTQTDTILDVGTGGGLPGIPLSIFFPKTQFYLIDGIAKKIFVANNIINELQLQNVSAQQIRVEHIRTKYNYIVSRAVTSFPLFYNLVKKNILTNKKTNGIIYLKGGDFEEELNKFSSHKIYSINKVFLENFFATKKIIYLPFE